MSVSEDPVYTLTVNGEKMEFSGKMNITQLLQKLGVKRSRIAVELNKKIISRDEHTDVYPSDGDMLEIVQFVGGG